MTEDTHPIPVVADEPAAKRQKIEVEASTSTEPVSVNANAPAERVKGITPIKSEYLLVRNAAPTSSDPSSTADANSGTSSLPLADYDDEAEGGGMENRAGIDANAVMTRKEKKARNKKESRGQNKGRKLVQGKDVVKLCESINSQWVKFWNEVADEDKQGSDNDGERKEDERETPEFECGYGERCRFEHDVPVYLAAKPKDIEGTCPVYEAIGYCPSGLKCRWLHSHYVSRMSKEQSTEGEEKKEGETVTEGKEEKPGHLLVNKTLRQKALENKTIDEYNRVPADILNSLQRKKYDFSLSEKCIKYMDARVDSNKKAHNSEVGVKPGEEENKNFDHSETQKAENGANEANSGNDKQDERASFVDGLIKPGEKKRLDLKGKYIVSPLTTVGNLPYRRLMKSLGADVTYSEMALALPIVQGQKSEWALPRAHSSEAGSFGVQITAAKHWQAIKAAEAISNLSTPGTISEINLNCGCPIDLVYRSGAGSALLDNPSRLIRILEGMNAVTGDIPVTAKIRTGTRDNKPTAVSLVNRLVTESPVAAITIHGRSRAQRYTKLADWEYVGQVAAAVKEAGARRQEVEGDGRYQVPWVIGNGDVYSWEDWYAGVEQGVDSVMVARGALIKPWIFEEIEQKQHLDKSANERLEYIRQFCCYGLQHWGADEYGVNVTRRYLCEYLSFTHRYIPVGIMAHLPPKINDRPPPWQGRNELETLLGSADYRDWIKISEMFLGPASESFEFTPKHKSNSYSNNTTGSV